MRSPFKFLDAFTLKDKDTFFGRDEATRKLYDMLFASPIVMIYGLSGTGKTSLIQCGLASKFDGPDWFPLYIRRDQDINSSLQEALNRHLEKHELAYDLVEKIRFLYGEYLSPVYLIFDQLEELFILGSEEEQKGFINNIKSILDAKLACRIILVMREEYLGYLYEFERVIPNIFDFRLRVEPMNSSSVKQVLSLSFDKFNITLESPKEDRLEEMLKNISGEKFGVQLPYLQVYLDMLYLQEYERAYGALPPSETYPPFIFTKKGIEEIGEIEDVLDLFIEGQSDNIQRELQDKFKKSAKEGMVKKVLDAFVTRDGTKRPVHYIREGDRILPDNNFRELTHFASPAVLSFILSGLASRRILRFTDNSIELAHDSIATLIDQNRTDEERKVLDTYRRLKNSYIEYRDKQVYLIDKQIEAIDEVYSSLLPLEDHLLEFIESSREEVERLKKEKEEKERTKIYRTLFPIIVGLAALAIFLGIIAFRERNALARATIHFNLTTSTSLKNAGNYEEAINTLESSKAFINAKLFKRYKDSIKVIDARLEKYARIYEKVVQGDSLLKLDNSDLTDSFKLKALDKYEEALSIEEDTLTSLKVQNLRSSIKQDADKWYNKAQIFTEFGNSENNQMAIDALKYAIMLDSSRAEIITPLKESLGI